MQLSAAKWLLRSLWKASRVNSATSLLYLLLGAVLGRLSFVACALRLSTHEARREPRLQIALLKCHLRVRAGTAPGISAPEPRQLQAGNL